MSAQPRGRVSREPETATITDLSHEGRGVAHVDGKTVFIDDALPGEVVEWQRLKRNRNFDEGRLLRVIEPSPDRVEPRCAHFGVCGGCVLQHLSGERQLEFKQRQLTEALARIGKVTPDEILPPLQAAVWNYRRRARLAARWVPKKDRTVVGFRERSAPYIADLKRCEVLQAPLDQLIEPLSELLTGLSIRNRVPQIEVAVADNAVALVVRVLEPLTDADLELIREFGRVHSVQMFLQPGGYETVAPLDAPGELLANRADARPVDGDRARKAALSDAGLGAHRHQHRFRGRRRAVVHGGIGNFHSGQLANQGLKLKNVLQCPLRYLGLIRCIGRKKLGPLYQMVDNCGREM